MVSNWDHSRSLCVVNRFTALGSSTNTRRSRRYVRRASTAYPILSPLSYDAAVCIEIFPQFARKEIGGSFNLMYKHSRAQLTQVLDVHEITLTAPLSSSLRTARVSDAGARYAMGVTKAW